MDTRVHFDAEPSAGDDRWMTSGRQGRLYRFLVLARRLQSSEPRDKIFDFLSILKEEIVHPNLLVPDYKKSIADVYVDVTWIFIQNFLCLDIFELLYDRPAKEPRIPGLPSWANDWTQRSALELFLSERMAAGGLFPGGLYPKANPVQLSEDRRKIRLQV
jgi:hypothetical protein